MMSKERRRENGAFDFVLLAVLLAIFVSVLEAMMRKPAPEVMTVLGGALGVVITLFGVAVNHRWGTPKRASPEGSLGDRKPTEPTLNPTLAPETK